MKADPTVSNHPASSNFEEEWIAKYREALAQSVNVERRKSKVRELIGGVRRYVVLRVANLPRSATPVENSVAAEAGKTSPRKPWIPVAAMKSLKSVFPPKSTR
jgi:hypothetical protein